MEKTVRHFYQCLWTSPKYAALLFLFGLMLPVQVFAQKDTIRKDTIRKLTQVTVSSSTVPKLQTITPSQTISANEFSHYDAQNVADAIRDFAGVIIKDYGGIGGLKTVSVRGLGANQTAVLYDGVEISDAENGQIDLSKFNLTNVQEITLYNGQPATICMPARSFASASVLSIKTIKPTLTLLKPYQVTAGVNVGSFGLINPYLQWQQRLSDHWSYIINSYTENADGDYKYMINNGNSTAQQTRIGSNVAVQQADGALYWTKNDSNKFNLHINFYNSSQGLPGAVILYTPPPFGQHEWNRDVFLQAGYERIWESSLHLLLNTKLSQDYLRYLDPHFDSEAGRLDQNYTQHELYQSAAISYHIITNWEVSYSTDFSLNNIDANLTNFHYPTRITLLNVLATNYTIGKVVLQGSLLNTNITETVRSGATIPNSNVFSPTVMALFKPFTDPNLQVRAFYKRIFRNPTFAELYYGVVTNTDLKPEFGNEYDLGFTYNKSLTGLFDYVAFTTDAYYNNVTNKIVFNPGFDGARNFGKVDIEGLDASLKTQANIVAGYKLSLAVNYSYQSALNVTDPASSTYLNQLPYIPKNSLAFNAGISKSHIGFYYNQILSSSRYYNNNNLPDDYLPPYSISTASVVYKNSIQKFPFMASFGVDNLYNKSYVVVQSNPMPGRSYRLSFQITI